MRAYTLIRTQTHANTHEHKHTHANTHTHTYKTSHTHTHAHISARACTPTQTHTQCSFVTGGPSLWNHLPDTVKEAGSIELFKQILKTVVFSQSIEILAFSNFVTVTSTLFDLFVVKKVLNVQPHRTTLLCLHVLCMERCEK